MGVWVDVAYNGMGLTVDVYGYEARHYRFRFEAGHRRCSRKEQRIGARYKPLDWMDVPPPVRDKLAATLWKVEQAAGAAKGPFE